MLQDIVSNLGDAVPKPAATLTELSLLIYNQTESISDPLAQ
jgi:hypothetical protein